MRIRTQIIITVARAAVLIGSVGAVGIYAHIALSKSLALTETINVARQLAETIVFKTSDAPRPLLERPEALREFVVAQHRDSKRDLIVVDRNKIILADIPGEEQNIGAPFNHDGGNEVSLTMQDGLPREFVETSIDMPAGVNLVAVPLEYPPGQIAGAVVLEYTKLLQETRQRAGEAIWWVALSATIAATIAAISALLLMRGFNAGMSSLTQGMQALARGDAGVRIDRRSNDEFGRLAQGFNTMAAELETSRAQLVDQKAYIEDIVQTVGEGISVIDGQGRIVSVNPAATEIVGRRSDKIEGQDWRSIIVMQSPSGDALEPHASPVELALTTGHRHQREIRLARPDGSHLPVIASCGPLNSSEGGVVLTLNDISDLRRAEQTVNERVEELAVLNRELRQNSEATASLVKLGELLQACVTFQEAFVVVGSAMPDFFGELSGTVHLTSASRNLVEEMANWGSVHSSIAQFTPEDCWALRRGQEHVSGPSLLTPRCSHILDGTASGYVCVPLAAQGETLGILHLCEPKAIEKPQWLAERHQILRGVADTLALALANLRLRETLRQQSIRDPNTGLFNRRYLEETGNRELRRMQRSDQPLTVIMLDVDHFKQFNDTFGHEAGDLVLKHVAGVLLDHAKDSDVASRYGGEEFALAMPGISLAGGQERAESLRQAIRELHLVHRGRTFGTVTASFGVAAFPESGLAWSDIITAVDHALYQAKSEGRDCVVVAKGHPPG